MSDETSIISALLSLKSDDQKKKETAKKLFTVLFWIDTQEFNVVPLSRVPKDKRKEGELAIVKAERKEWSVKLLKVGGRCNTFVVLKIHVHVCYVV